MKLKLTLLSILFFISCATFAQGNIKNYKDQVIYKGANIKEVNYKSAGLTVRTKAQKSQTVVTVIKGNQGKDLLVLVHSPKFINTTMYDLNKDGAKEIIVAYSDEDENISVDVFSSSTYKKLGNLFATSPIELKNNRIYEYKYHSDNTEVNVYGVKKNKLEWLDETVKDVRK